MIAIAFIGYHYFGESLGIVKILGITVLIAGVVLVTADGKPVREYVVQNAQWIHYVYMAAAILLEVAANIFVNASQGWRRLPGIIGVACILASFTAQAQAVKGIDLSIAYALSGGTGIVLTSAAGWTLFRQALSHRACLGLALIVSGMLLLKLS